MAFRVMPAGAQEQRTQPQPELTQQQFIAPEKSSMQATEGEGSVLNVRHKGIPFFKRLMNKAYFWRLKYYFVAQNTKNCDIFYGLVQDDPLIGYASVDFSFPNGCRCRGHAKVTHYAGSTVGQRGWVKADCSDGRILKGNFTTTSLTTGHWQATDSLGNEYQGSFGHTADEAVSSVNTIRRKLHCPECDPRDIELKVQGQIISPQP